MPPNNGTRESGRIEALKRWLYTRDNDGRVFRRSTLDSLTTELAFGWEKTRHPNDQFSCSPRSSWLTIFLIVALIFFLSAVGFAGYTLYRGGNIISSANVELLIDGPKTVKAGETLNLQVLMSNKNTVPLYSVDLIIEFAPGTRSPLDVTKELTRTRVSVGTIKSGTSINQTVKAVAFGEKDVDQVIKISVEYRIADSNAIFDKTSVFHYQISSAPITLNLTLPTEVNSGQVVDLDLELTAMNDASIRDLVVVVAYPPGFTFTSATPPPAIGTNVWRLGDIPAGARPHLKILGKIEGQDDDSKSFRFSAGLESTRTEGEIAVNYGEIFKIMTIKRPFVALNISVNGESLAQEYVTGSGDFVRTDIAWTNNLPMEVTDGELTITLSGLALDQRTVATSDGFYQSATNQIVWRQGTLPALAHLAPGDHGQVSFNFASLPLIRSDRSVITRPTIDLNVSFRGRRTTVDSSGELIETTVKKQIKVSSVFQLASVAKYYDGPFTNTGPLPPKVGQETTYTILWSVINSSNDVTGATVRATLPAYVRWVGTMNPESESVTFDSSRGEVTWDLDAVDAGRGLTSAAREVAFQVVLLPSVSQIGETPVLITTPILSGTDSFTHQILTSAKKSIDIRIIGDSRYQPSDGAITQ